MRPLLAEAPPDKDSLSSVPFIEPPAPLTPEASSQAPFPSAVPLFRHRAAPLRPFLLASLMSVLPIPQTPSPPPRLPQPGPPPAPPPLKYSVFLPSLGTASSLVASSPALLAVINHCPVAVRRPRHPARLRGSPSILPRSPLHSAGTAASGPRSRLRSPQLAFCHHSCSRRALEERVLCPAQAGLKARVGALKLHMCPNYALSLRSRCVTQCLSLCSLSAPFFQQQPNLPYRMVKYNSLKSRCAHYLLFYWTRPETDPPKAQVQGNGSHLSIFHSCAGL